MDVIARALPAGASPAALIPPDPLPEELVRAIARVARDFDLPGDWMNTAVAHPWTQGLPPSLAEDIEWRTYGGLEVGLVSRRTLIALKLFAATDQGPRSVHARDLVALAPTDDELDSAAEWVRTQDASPHFPGLIEQVIAYVRESRDHW